MTRRRYMERIEVYVHADDPISRAGVASQLRPRPEVRVLEPANAESATVALVVGDRVCDRTLQVLRTLQRSSARLVLVVAEVDDTDLVAAVEAGIVGLVRRAD